VSDTGVNEAGLFDAGNNFYGVTESFLGLGHEAGILSCMPYGAGTGSTYAARMHLPKTFAKSRQTVKRTLPRIGRKVAAGGQALCKPHGFLNAINNGELTMTQLPNNHVKAVRAEVNARDYLRLAVLRR
jgi:hypothetical protein